MEVYPGSGHGPDCEQRGALDRGSVTITGTCQTPLAPNVPAVYSLTDVPNAATIMARANLSWS